MNSYTALSLASCTAAGVSQQQRLAEYAKILGKIRVAGDYYVELDVQEFELDDHSYGYSVLFTMYHVDVKVGSFLSREAGGGKLYKNEFSCVRKAVRAIIEYVTGRMDMPLIIRCLVGSRKNINKNGLQHFLSLIDSIHVHGYALDPLRSIDKEETWFIVNDALSVVCNAALESGLNTPSPSYMYDFFKRAQDFVPDSVRFMDGGFAVIINSLAEEETFIFRTNDDDTITLVDTEDVLHKRYALVSDLMN